MVDAEDKKCLGVETEPVSHQLCELVVPEGYLVLLPDVERYVAHGLQDLRNRSLNRILREPLFGEGQSSIKIVFVCQKASMS